jgi:hypothetical protein
MNADASGRFNSDTQMNGVKYSVRSGFGAGIWLTIVGGKSTGKKGFIGAP